MASVDRRRKNAPAAGPPPVRQPSFFQEIYWFTVICLGAWILALAVVPPRASHYRRLLELEGRLEHRRAEIERQAEALDAAIISMRDDPVYREAIYRKVLGVKKNHEEFLDLSAAAGR